MKNVSEQYVVEYESGPTPPPMLCIWFFRDRIEDANFRHMVFDIDSTGPAAALASNECHLLPPVMMSLKQGL